MKKIKEIYKVINKYSNKKKYIINKKKIKICGRIVSKRSMGISTFINVQDIKGNIQILLSKKYINKKKIPIIKKIKIGYIIYIEGFLFKTKTKELTIKCIDIKILKKIHEFFPDKFHKLKNKEIKYKKRYIDLIINSKTRKTFLNRIKIIKLIRKFLNKKNFLEVETPMLHKIPGGANAKPFKTYHNKLKKNIYLRIAPELYLKKLIIGGFTKIFELNRNFRNEGISSKHNPEFTMIEIYHAYKNYKYMMNLIEKMIYYLTININKKKIIIFNKKKINFSIPYKKISIKKAIYKYSKLFKNIEDLNNNEKILKIAKKLKIKIKKNYIIDKIILKIFDITTSKYLIQPTFITKYSINISPLAKQNKKNKNIADRFELFIAGKEICNGFTELNNHKKQLIQFKKQIKIENKNKNFLNKEYIKSLKYGLPPTAGVGLGIDRLIMILTNNKSIKNVIFFPII